MTPSQRMTRPDGLPTTAARAGVVALMAVAATAGYGAAPERRAAAAPQVVDASGLAGDLPIAAPEAQPALQRAHAIPALLRDTARRPARRAAAPAATPTPEPAATRTPEPAATATPEPVATATPTTAPVAAPPAAPPVPVATPRPRSTPAPTFDSSG